MGYTQGYDGAYLLGHEAEGGATASVLVSTEGAGFAREHAIGGSEVTVATSAEGAGLPREFASGGAEATVVVSAEAQGLAGGRGSSTATTLVGAEGGGFAFEVPPFLEAVAISETQVDLSWGAALGAEAYDVERDGQVIAADITTTSYSDFNATPGAVNTYRVRSTKARV